MSVVGPVSSASVPRWGIRSCPARFARRFAQVRRGALWAALASSAGCAAIRAQVEIQGAIDAQRAAEPARPAELAPYEHAMAARYLEKAWEELGSREYRTSVDLARTSREWSELAATTASKAGPSDLQDAPPPPAPAPTIRVVPGADGPALPEPSQPLAPVEAAPAGGAPPATPTETVPPVVSPAVTP